MSRNSYQLQSSSSEPAASSSFCVAQVSFRHFKLRGVRLPTFLCCFLARLRSSAVLECDHQAPLMLPCVLGKVCTSVSIFRLPGSRLLRLPSARKLSDCDVFDAFRRFSSRLLVALARRRCLPVGLHLFLRLSARASTSLR